MINKTSNFTHYRAKLMLALGVCMTAWSAPSVAQEQAVIALFGDSITTGFNANFGDDVAGGTTTRGLPTIELNSILTSEKRKAVVANWGDGGTNSEQGAGRIVGNLRTNSLNHVGNAYYVLIIYGTNDFGYGISASQNRFNLQLMIDRARAEGYEPIIGTLTPRDDRDIGPYNSAIRSGASSKGAFLVDHYARFIAENPWQSLIDSEVIMGKTIRLHPNDNGYQVIAQYWFDTRLDSLLPVSATFDSSAINLLLLSTD